MKVGGMMADKYRNFVELRQNEEPCRGFCICFRDRGARTLVLAPHGGKTEPGTSEIADAIASDDLSFYSFEGIKSRGNGQLHIKSPRFDEPQCVNLVKASTKAISIHGCSGQSVRTMETNRGCIQLILKNTAGSVNTLL
jgi:phage replication-related protein YjqB (UPF0714/DUF867 family)